VFDKDCNVSDKDFFSRLAKRAQRKKSRKTASHGDRFGKLIPVRKKALADAKMRKRLL